MPFLASWQHPAKFARVKELLLMERVIKEARKTLDEDVTLAGSAGPAGGG